MKKCHKLKEIGGLLVFFFTLMTFASTTSRKLVLELDLSKTRPRAVAGVTHFTSPSRLDEENLISNVLRGSNCPPLSPKNFFPLSLSQTHAHTLSL